MKLAVISDLHIGLGPRWTETQRVLGWCVERVRERRPDAILIGGDVFDRRSLPEERTWGADFLLGLADIAPVVGCSGNHDAPLDLAIFNRLRGTHALAFYEEPTVHRLGDIAVAVLPWDRSAPTLEMLRMTGVERRAAETEARRGVLVKLGAELDSIGVPSKLFLGHVELREAMPAIGQPEKRGRSFEMTLDDLALVRAHGYALGHVHAAQRWEIGGSPCFYPGSVTRRSYGEREDKHIAFLDIDGPRVAVELMQTPARPLLLVDAAWVERAPGVWGWSVDVDEVRRDAQGADVRFTYQVDEERRAAAALAAEEVLAGLKAAGAGMTKPEEKVLPRAQARAPEIASASTFEEKLAITLVQKGHPREAPGHQRVVSLFRELMGQRARGAAGEPLTLGGGPFKLHQVQLRGLGPFCDEVVLDLDALGGDLVVVAGDIGEGKSTLLEAWPGALHPRRKTPTRGTFDGLAEDHGRDAFVDVAFTFGPRHVRVRHDVGRGEAHVYIDGDALKLDGKVSKVGAWVEHNMLPPEVMTGGIFLPQRSEGLVAADGAARREALLLSIGIGEIEARAEEARRALRAAEKALKDHHAETDRVRRRAAEVPALEERHRAAQGALATAEDRRAALISRIHVTGRAEIAAFSMREQERAAALERRSAADRAHAGAVDRARDLDRRAIDLRALLAGAATIRAGAARARAIAAELPQIRADLAVAQKTATDAAAWAAQEERARGAEGTRWKDADARRVRAARRAADADAVRLAVSMLDQARADRAAADGAVADLERRAADVRARAASTAETRIEATRTALGAVETARRLADAKATARAALGADDAAVAGADPDALARIEADLVAARARAGIHAEGVAATDRLAARSADVEAAWTELGEAAAAMAAAEAAGKAARARAEGARAAGSTAEARAAELGAAVAALEEEARALADLVAREGEIAGADAGLAEVEAQQTAARADVARLAADLAALPPVPDPLPRPDLAAAEAELDAVTKDLAGLGSASGLAVQALDAARAAAADLPGREAALAELEERAADHALLADCLGIGGVQALEIDAAGPALTASFNELLHASYGSRFTGEVTASRPTKDGKGRVDECEIVVHDALRGRRGDVRTFSGGERVHLATAFFLALARYVCTTRQLTEPTLVLDEPGAGLGEAFIGPWVDMVRHAARSVGASKVVIITHHPLIIDAADTVVRVRDGRLAVER